MPTSNHRSGSRFRRYLRPALLTAFAAILGAVLYFTISAYLKPVHAQNTSPAEAANAANALKSQLDVTEKRLEDIQKFLAELIAAAGIFAFAAGVFSYFNFKELKESAREQMDKLEKDFPAIAGINDRIERVSREIGDGLVSLDEWDKGTYRELSEAKRQSIRMNEAAFSALELFDLSKSADLARQGNRILIAFGRFHGSHYYCENDNQAIERAKIYLRKAKKSNDLILRERALSDLGVVSCWHIANLTDPTMKIAAVTEARGSFDDACALRSYNPSALIGRAWLKRRENDLKGAIEDLTGLIEAADEKKLTNAEKQRYVTTGYFNRACYRVVQAHGYSTPEKADAHQRALDDLWKYKGVAIQGGIFPEFLDDLDRELPAGKDLHPLAHGHTAALKDLRDRTKAHP